LPSWRGGARRDDRHHDVEQGARLGSRAVPEPPPGRLRAARGYARSRGARGHPTRRDRRDPRRSRPWRPCRPTNH
jgi:hypothetical protein